MLWQYMQYSLLFYNQNTIGLFHSFEELKCAGKILEVIFYVYGSVRWGRMCVRGYVCVCACVCVWCVFTCVSVILIYIGPAVAPSAIGTGACSREGTPPEH